MDYFGEDIPSNKKDLLKKAIGKSITFITRCSWDNFKDFDQDNLYNISQNDFFRLTSGAAVITLNDGLEIGFSSQEDISSIIIWIEKDDLNQKNDDYYRNDEDFYLIKNTEKVYTSLRENQLSGGLISNIKILKRVPQNAKYEGLPNEVGIQIDLKGGESLIMAHNLIESSDSFSITYKDKIDNDIFNEIIEEKL